MINTKMGAFLLVGFIAGAFIASPELRAYAANTVFSTDIKDGEVKTPDLANNAVTSTKIKDGEVKTADIATGAVAAGRIADGAVGTLKLADNSIAAVDIAPDAVGASELQGVDKLIFADCIVPPGFSGGSGFVMQFQCTIAGVDSEDNAIATLEGSAGISNFCFVLKGVDPGEGKVGIQLKNVCTINASTVAGHTVSVIVYDELPDKIPPTLP